jgi:hypothetical protein
MSTHRMYFYTTITQFHSPTYFFTCAYKTCCKTRNKHKILFWNRCLDQVSTRAARVGTKSVRVGHIGGHSKGIRPLKPKSAGPLNDATYIYIYIYCCILSHIYIYIYTYTHTYIHTIPTCAIVA